MLGVAENATTDEVKKAFRALAREVHPDVAGDDPKIAERFKTIRGAYEVLVDPPSRQRYDRRRQGPTRPPPGRFGFQSSKFTAHQANTSHTQSRSEMDLEDIFADHGGILDFGFGGPGGPKTPGAPPPRPRAQQRMKTPKPGSDVVLRVELGHRLADDGGTLRLEYTRLVRSDGSKPTLKRVDEIHHLRISSGTSHGDTLRVPLMGDGGVAGGPYGDLVCDVHVQAGASPGSAKGDSDASSSNASTRAAPGEPLVVPISVAECVLGGQVAIQTPQGQVRVNVPPCTPGGSRLRLRGKGPTGPSGGLTDLIVQLRVVPPALVDDESRDLIARFAVLNPQDPRSD